MNFEANYYSKDVIEYGKQLVQVIDNKMPFNELLVMLGHHALLGARFQTAYRDLPHAWQYQAIFAEVIGNICDPGISMALTIHNDMVLPMLYRYPTAMLEKIANSAIKGQCILAHAVTEETSGSDLSQLVSEASITKSGVIINGKKCYVTNGNIADYFCTLVKLAKPSNYPFNLAMVLIPAIAPGLSITKHHIPWGNQQVSLVDISLDKVFVESDYIIGSTNAGFIVQASQFEQERIISSFRATAIAARILNYTVSQCRNRQLGTETVFAKQVVKHQLARLKIDIDCSYATNHAGLKSIINNHNDLMSISCLAKWLSSKVVRVAARTCLQLCGAAGYIQQHFAEAMLRDTRLFSISTGADELMFKTVMKKMVEPTC